MRSALHGHIQMAVFQLCLWDSAGVVSLDVQPTFWLATDAIGPKAFQWAQTEMEISGYGSCDGMCQAAD